MGIWTLYDPDIERAVFYDSVRERPVPYLSFIGTDAREQAESFLAWLDEQGLLFGLVTKGENEARHEEWAKACLDDEGRLRE